jgi:GR25 family glycosyltransferase involved in LPS biosynthesis
MEGIDAVYIINLEKRPRKWIESIKRLKKWGIAANRFVAIDGALLQPSDFSVLCDKGRRGVSPGQVGCLLSHLSVMQEALKRGCEVVWICEDDIVLLKDPHLLSDYLQELTKASPKWDIFYTDSQVRYTKAMDAKKAQRGERYIPILTPHAWRPAAQKTTYTLAWWNTRIPLTDNIEQLRYRHGAYSYIISKRGMEKVMAYFATHKLVAPYDVDIHLVPGILQYCPLGQEIVSVDTTSAISDTAN